MKYYYDLHLHSCLSPCADDDMTPHNITGMAKLCGLDLVALTDHNTAKNCPAFFKAAARYGITPIAGLELTTAEDIHVICLFETLEAALQFDSDLQAHRTLIPNRTDIFGNQSILDGNDEVIGEEPHLLSNATDISVEDVPQHMARYGGICYPAHIDRQANGIISVLGTFPDTPHFTCAEVSRKDAADALIAQYPILRSKQLLVSSDAHQLTAIKDKENYLELDGDDVVKALLEKLRMKN